MTDFERKGEEALERAKELLAKAKGGLDRDFEDLDEPDLPEELDATDDLEDEEERAAQHDEELQARGHDEDGEEDEDEEEAKPVAKAVDAVPILAAIEERLRRVEALERRLALMVKALESLTSGVRALAKGYGALAEAPRKPKAHMAVVPTGAPKLTVSEVFAKATSLVKDPLRVGILEHFANRGDLEGLLANLTPEERAKVLGGE